MTKHDKYKDAPHFDLIRENETIEIDSVFLFKDVVVEFIPFLDACKAFNCTVRFKNEGLTATPDGDRAILNMYAMVATHPRIAEDYMACLAKLGRGEIKFL